MLNEWDAMARFEFTKMHGLGNDFVVFDGISQRIPGTGWPKLAQRICDRNLGIGADGVIFALPSDDADAKMRIINSDGSEAEISGNGLRCMVRMLRDRGHISTDRCRVETGAGIVAAEAGRQEGADFMVRLELKPPVFEAKRVPVTSGKAEFLSEDVDVGNRTYSITALSVGNPHAVVFVDDYEFDWRKTGAKIETHEIFPEKANVEFVVIENPKRIRLKSWERGAGPTHASGTGACAAACAGIKLGRLEPRVEVVCDYGSLFVEWDGGDDALYQSGPSAYVFEGEIDFDSL